jgi:hypothetical protein
VLTLRDKVLPSSTQAIKFLCEQSVPALIQHLLTFPLLDMQKPIPLLLICDPIRVMQATGLDEIRETIATS